MTGSYDPGLNLIYWGTGNPTPVLNGSTRPGNNLYTCSIVAINPDTGKLAWAFQVSPHDTHDWDAVETPVLVDGDFNGHPRKMLMQTSRNGYFFVLDRTNGKSLLTIPYGPVNWSLGIDKQGHPIPNPKKEPAPDGRLIAPDEGGPITAGSLVIDELTYSVRLRGRVLDLTYKEFELLKHLAQHPGRVFTRSQLLQEVWGYDYFGGTRTVDVHVRRLRAKLGTDYEVLIGTVRNVGYRFVPEVDESFSEAEV